MAPKTQASTAHSFAMPHEVAAALGYYVYLLRDPRDGTVFYVGKGVGQRVYSHVNRAVAGKPDPDLDPPKVKRIHAILSKGRSVEHLLVRTNIDDEATAYIIEQSVIDGLRAAGHELTNKHSGHQSSTYGLATVSDAVARLAAPAAPPLPLGSVVFIINRAWRPGDGPDAVYDATHGHWKIGQRSRDRARQAFGVSFGIIRGAFDIEDWYPDSRRTGRWGFTGTPSTEYANYVGTHVRNVMKDSGPGSQNPVRLFL